MRIIKIQTEIFEYVQNNHTINKDDKYFQEFYNIPAKNKITYSAGDYKDIKLKLWGDFNVANAAAAIKTAEIYGIKPELAVKILENIESLPGRMELIEEGNKFKVIVDYAHTPDSMEVVYGSLKPKLTVGARLICVFGATGGGRDKWKRPEYGKIAERYCDEIILTNEDPYDENPVSILEQIETGFSQTQGSRPQRQSATMAGAARLRKIIDRREAIKKASVWPKKGIL